jgi:hypothetical protein
VVAVRLAKPDVPESVRQNFLEVAAQAANLQTLQEREAVVLAGAAKSAKLAAMEARKLREVTRVFLFVVSF